MNMTEATLLTLAALTGWSSWTHGAYLQSAINRAHAQKTPPTTHEKRRHTYTLLSGFAVIILVFVAGAILIRFNIRWELGMPEPGDAAGEPLFLTAIILTVNAVIAQLALNSEVAHDDAQHPHMRLRLLVSRYINPIGFFLVLFLLTQVAGAM